MTNAAVPVPVSNQTTAPGSAGELFAAAQALRATWQDEAKPTAAPDPKKESVNQSIESRIFSVGSAPTAPSWKPQRRWGEPGLTAIPEWGLLPPPRGRLDDALERPFNALPGATVFRREL
jgi:hypothetical protein